MGLIVLAAGIFLAIWAFLQRGRPGFRAFAWLVPLTLLLSSGMVAVGSTAGVFSLVRGFTTAAAVSPQDKAAHVGGSIEHALGFVVLAIAGGGLFTLTVLGAGVFVLLQYVRSRPSGRPAPEPPTGG